MSIKKSRSPKRKSRVSVKKKSRSPKRSKSRSPRKRSQSPRKRSRSPKKKSRGKSRSPRKRSRSPRKRSQSPRKSVSVKSIRINRRSKSRSPRKNKSSVKSIKINKSPRKSKSVSVNIKRNSSKKSVNVNRKEYTVEEIKEQLKGFIKIDKPQLKYLSKLKLYYTKIRYFDDRFKLGGILIKVNKPMEENGSLVLRSGKITWTVYLKNLKYLWVSDPQIVKEKILENKENRKIKKEEKEKKENICDKLYNLYINKQLSIKK